MNTVEKQKLLKEYADSLKGKTLEELQVLEQEVIKEAETIEKDVAKKEFPLKKENWKETATAIRYILDKRTVAWQYTPALVSMFEFWDPEKKPKTVIYAMLDSTLRTLGEQQFTGYNECKAVVVINAYFEDIREEYANCVEQIYDIASKHNAIMDQMDLVKPIGTVEPGKGVTA